MVALFAWSPWAEPTDVEWLGSYRAWSDETGAALQTGLVVSRVACESSFDEEVGQPPTQELAPVAEAARGGCAAPTPERWGEGSTAVVRALVDLHDDVAPPRRRRDLGAIATSGVGVRPDVYCWLPAAWAPFLEQYAVVRGGWEASLQGAADPGRNRIDLAPALCEAFVFFLRRERPHELSYENFELAQALAVLTHQAEHLEAPSASEADVECYALQHVRPLVRGRGFEAGYAAELAQQYWELSYLKLPEPLRSPDCRDGGRLDRHPSSTAWP